MTKRRIAPDGAPAALGPYSQGIDTGELVFCSGQLGLDPASGQLAQGAAAQAERALRNIGAVLDAAGCTRRAVDPPPTSAEHSRTPDAQPPSIAQRRGPVAVTSPEPSTVAIVLAAGLGTRMRSRRPKVLHPLCGRPMLAYVLDAARPATRTRPLRRPSPSPAA